MTYTGKQIKASREGSTAAFRHFRHFLGRWFMEASVAFGTFRKLSLSSQRCQVRHIGGKECLLRGLRIAQYKLQHPSFSTALKFESVSFVEKVQCEMKFFPETFIHRKQLTTRHSLTLTAIVVNRTAE